MVPPALAARSAAAAIDRTEAHAAPPPAKKKTNSDRGKEFRAKRKEYEDRLVTTVDALRREVDDLRFLRGVRQESYLRSRASRTGSLARLAQEYFAFFQNGMVDAIPTGNKRAICSSSDASGFAAKQTAFLHCAMDPDLRYGDLRGVLPLLDQWKRYTSYHASLRVEVVSIDVSGPSESPVVTVTSHLHVRYSRSTFENVFPHVADNEALVKRFLGKDVTYRGVNQFQFSDAGQIVSYDSDVGFVDALVRAGASMSDIALLMNQAMITSQAVIDDEENGGESGENQASHDREPLLSPLRDYAARTPDNEEDTDSEHGCSSEHDDSSNDEQSGATSKTPPVEPAAQPQHRTSRLDIRFLLS